jgi:hypothetical protein
MDAFAFANQFPIISLIGGGVKEPWIPHERSRNAPPIDEMHGELIVTDEDLHRTRFRLNG